MRKFKKKSWSILSLVKPRSEHAQSMLFTADCSAGATLTFRVSPIDIRSRQEASIRGTWGIVPTTSWVIRHPLWRRHLSNPDAADFNVANQAANRCGIRGVATFDCVILRHVYIHASGPATARYEELKSRQAGWCETKRFGSNSSIGIKMESARESDSPAIERPGAGWAGEILIASSQGLTSPMF